MSVSLSMIIKNEQDYLEDCLLSVNDVVDEIVIVDTGSSDKSIEIASKFDAQIFNFKWTSDFSEARNFALEKCSSDWILHLDADERLDENSKPIFKKSIQQKDVDAFELIVRNLHPTEDMVAYLDSPQIRFFRNYKNYFFQNKIHEQISPSIIAENGVIKSVPIIINHLGYRENNGEKAKRNIDILEEALKSNPQDAYLWFKKGETYKSLNQLKDAHNCFLKALKFGQNLLSDEILETLYMRLAQIELQSENYPQCIKYAQESLKINPNNAVVSYVLAVALIYTKQIQAAYKILIALNQNDNLQHIKRQDIQQLLFACEQLIQK